MLTGQAQLASGDSKDVSVATWQQLVKAAPKSRMADQARYKLAQVESHRR